MRLQVCRTFCVRLKKTRCDVARVLVDATDEEGAKREALDLARRQIITWTLDTVQVDAEIEPAEEDGR